MYHGEFQQNHNPIEPLGQVHALVIPPDFVRENGGVYEQISSVRMGWFTNQLTD